MLLAFMASCTSPTGTRQLKNLSVPDSGTMPDAELSFLDGGDNGQLPGGSDTEPASDGQSAADGILPDVNPDQDGAEVPKDTAVSDTQPAPKDTATKDTVKPKDVGPADAGKKVDATKPPDNINDCPKAPPLNAPCNPYCQLGCPENEHCTFSGGLFGCVDKTKGTKKDWDSCNSPTDCVEGLACFGVTGESGNSCKRFCMTNDDCPGDPICSLVVNFFDGAKASFCSYAGEGCNPFKKGSGDCPDDKVCVLKAGDITQCLPQGVLKEGQPCADKGVNACDAGLQCIVTCQKICSMSDSNADQPKCSSLCNGNILEIDGALKLGVCLSNTAPSTCNIFKQTGCKAAKGCYPVKGGWACAEAGQIPQGGKCTYTNDCVPGTMCASGKCRKICSTNSNVDPALQCANMCPGAASLEPALWGVGLCMN